MKADLGELGIDEFREQAREWFSRNVPAGWQEQQLGVDHDGYLAFQRKWFETMRSGPYLVPHWPREWGGGFDLAQQAVISEELARADGPRLELHFVSRYHAALPIIRASYDEQRENHLRAILDGAVWCQGFSEPNAGSDLASLSTTAQRHGDVYVVQGQKVWTSRAPDADWCLLLARTSPGGDHRAGFSLFAMDMRSPGVDVRPILDANGWPHFAEVFLDGVEVPVNQRIGAEGDGWRVARVALTAERGLTIVELAERMWRSLDRIIAEAENKRDEWGRRLLDDRGERRELAALYTEVTILRQLSRRMVAQLVGGQSSGSEASVLKVFYSELLHRLTDVALRWDGLAGQRRQGLLMSGGFETGSWLADHLRARQWLIGGGTNDIQRNLIGERMLGLPREQVAR